MKPNTNNNNDWNNNTMKSKTSAVALGYRKRIIIGVAALAILTTACGDYGAGASPDKYGEFGGGDFPPTSAEAEPQTRSDDIDFNGTDLGVTIVSTLLENRRHEMCGLYNDALDTDVLTESQLIDFSIEQFDEGYDEPMTPEIEQAIEDFLRSC